jgi:hypothetical protein
LELHKNWIDPKILIQAKKDVLDNRDKSWKKQNRINLSQVESKAIEEIAAQCQSITWFPYMPERSGAQIHEPNSKGDSAQTWHQDIVALGGEHGCVAWVPLDPLDGTRPSIMFAGERPSIRHYKDERDFSVALDPVVETATLILKMELGDIIVFNWSELHSTYWPEGLTNGRVSLDLRYAPEVQ